MGTLEIIGACLMAPIMLISTVVIICAYFLLYYAIFCEMVDSFRNKLGFEFIFNLSSLLALVGISLCILGEILQ